MPQDKITWFQDSGDILVPNYKKEETNNGVVLFMLPKTVERFLKGWTYDISLLQEMFGDNGEFYVPNSSGETYYLADKPNIEIKNACFDQGSGTDKAYFITIHVFRIIDNSNENGGGGGHPIIPE